ncbi:hypothetical protein, variant, partial [Sphaeroforma arctica JP610]
TSVFVHFCQKKLGNGRRLFDLPKIHLSVLMVLFFIGAVLSVYVEFPHFLQNTDPEIQALKAEGRRICEVEMKMGNLIEADQALRAAGITSKQLAAEFSKKARQDIDRMLRPIVNRVFINGLGVACAPLPFFAILSALYAKSFGISTPLAIDRGIAQAGFIDLVRTGSVYGIIWTALSFFVYFVFIESHQYDQCMEISGHWFMYTVTTACMFFLGTLAWCYDSRLMGFIYLGFCGVYQAMVLRVLKSTQHFFHDKEEALQGIKYGILCTAVCLFFSFGVMSTLEDPKHVNPLHNTAEEPISLDDLPPPPPLSDDEDDMDVLPPAPSIPDELPPPVAAPTVTTRSRKSEELARPAVPKPAQALGKQVPTNTQPVTKAAGGSSFLDDIKRGKQLKPTSPLPSEAPKSPIPPNSIYDTINKMESSDDGWSD